MHVCILHGRRKVKGLPVNCLVALHDTIYANITTNYLLFFFFKDVYNIILHMIGEMLGGWIWIVTLL